MLLCNDRLVDPTKSTAPDKFYKDKVTELKRLKWPLRFTFPENLKTRVVTVDGNMKEGIGYQKPKGHLALLQRNYRSKDGIQRWVYYDRITYDDKTGRPIYGPRRYHIKDSMVLNEGDIELAFFLIYVSGHCEVIESLTEQTPDQRKIYMVLDDKSLLAKKLASQRRDEFQVMRVLYDREVIDDEKLKVLAKSYFVDGVEEMEDLDSARNQLFDIIAKSSDKKAIEKFLDSVKLPDHVKIRAMLKDALEARILFVKKGKTDQQWRWVGEGGEEGDIILDGIRLSERPNKYLVDHILANPEVGKAIQSEVDARVKKK